MYNIDYKKKAEEIENWIVKTVQKAGFQDVVLALSGGIDSAVSATLAVRALNKEHVHVLLLPYGDLNKKGDEDGQEMARFLQLSNQNVHKIDIKKAVDAFHLQNVSAIRKGNSMARVRMTYLYDFAKANNCLVVGTENKSEYYLGYFTRFGDEASDIEPIRNLYKTQVFEIAKFLGLPQHIIEKAPSAGLWESQTDESEFGFSYTDADRILYHHFEEELGEEAIVDLGVSKDIVKNVLVFVAKNDFKHKLPYIFEE